MPDVEPSWEIMQDAEAHALTVYRSNGFAADSEGPTLRSREEFERFVGDLREAADRVWPPEGDGKNLLRRAVRIVARAENDRGVMTREGRDFLADARRALGR